MTDRLELIHELHLAGGTLTLEGETLFVAPDSIEPGLVSRLRQAKPELLRILASTRERCPVCCGPVAMDKTHDGYLNRLCLKCGRWLRCVREDAVAAESCCRRPIAGSPVTA